MELVTPVSAAVARASKNEDGARAMLRFLAGPEVARVLARYGLESP